MTQSWEIEGFLDVRDKQLHIDGVNAVELAREYGTPLFVFSETRIRRNIARLQKVDSVKIPDIFDYLAVPQLRHEAKEKLNRLRPTTVGQASRVSGITPADIAILMFYLKPASS